MPQNFGLPQVEGNIGVTNASATGVIIAAQGAGKVLRIRKGCVSVTLAAAGTGGLVRLCNGTTTIMQWQADSVGAYNFDLGEAGYPITANTAFQLIVSGAVTTQASAYCIATAFVA